MPCRCTCGFWLGSSVPINSATFSPACARVSKRSRVSHPGLSLFRQRLYQIIAGYEDANDADRLRHDPAFQILADQPQGAPLGSQPTLSRWENSPSPRDLLKLQDALLDWFVKICGEQVLKRGEILLDVDSTDDPTY